MPRVSYSTRPSGVFYKKVTENEKEEAKAYAMEHFRDAQSFDFMNECYPIKGEDKARKSLFYIGTEFETLTTSCTHNSIEYDRLCEKYLPEVYTKNDASLTHDDRTNLEVITNPCTIGYWFNSKLAERLVEVAKRVDFTSENERCGMHFHVSRAPYKKASLDMVEVEAKWIVIFERFWNELLKISARDSSRAEHWASRTRKSTIAEAREFAEWQKRGHDRRYYCVNTQNAQTIEVRLFAGTMDARRIKAYVSIVNHIAQFILHGGDVEHCTFAEAIRYDHQPQVVAEYLHNLGLV